VVVLAQLPLTPNGKVDRNALPEPDFNAEQLFVGPVGEAESVLARIWADVLGVERIGRTDNFFERGGHSLLAIRLLEAVRQAGWAADIRTLFRQPVLADFAAELAQKGCGCRTRYSTQPHSRRLCAIGTGDVKPDRSVG
jgi:aryl carrier-like protein